MFDTLKEILHKVAKSRIFVLCVVMILLSSTLIGRLFYLQIIKGEEYQDNIEALIKHVDIPVKAVLGQSVISVMDFASLQVGDIIRLDRGVEDEMDVYVGNIKKFTAVPGASKENYAVRVTSIIREEE